MGKQWFFIPMILLLLLSGCFGRGTDNSAEQLALTIRSDYLSARVLSAQVDLTADYGQRVYHYQMDVQSEPQTTTMTITSPESIAGITATYTETDSRATLMYEDISVETGSLDSHGLTPVSSVPAIIQAIRSGYMTACAKEESGLLRMDCGSATAPVGTGTEYRLWFEPETHTLVQSEIFVDGARCISCTFSQFTKE